MKLSTTNHACCPNCGQVVTLTAAASLQARQRGVWCDCSFCDSEWIHVVRQGDSRGPRRVDSPHLLGDGPQLKLVTPLPIESTVFIVGANPVMCGRLGYLMASAGLRIQTFCTAEEFLTISRSSRPGCLVFDIDLPGMSGLELHQQLGQMESRLPLIVLTTTAYMTTDMQTLKQNVFAFFQKPGDPKAILEAVRQAIAQDTAARQQESMQAPRRAAGARSRVETIERRH